MAGLARGSRPTAIVAFNDIMAIGAMNTIQAASLQVGNDIAFTGFDNTPMTQYYLRPGLTPVRQPIWQAGQAGLSVLLEILNEDECEENCLLLSPELIIRRSSTV